MYSEKIFKINRCLEDIKNYGNVEKVSNLYALVGPAIRYIALKYMKDSDAANDLIQDFWADIYNIANDFKYLSNGFNYLCRVMTNRAINEYRNITRQNEYVMKYVPYENYVIINEVDIDDFIYARQLVNKAMSYLNEQEKIIIQETYFLGKTIREIAREMGISKSYTHKLKQRAISIMADAIAIDEID